MPKNKCIKRLLVAALFMLSGCLGIWLSLHMHPRTATDVQLIQTFHYPTLFVKQLKGDRHAGEKIFNQFCTSCHGKQPVIDIPTTPRIDDKAAWRRLQQQGIAVLLKNTLRGRGAMPARGGCFECSDEQLLQAIHYMLTKSDDI